jgi:hypothetical protein
MSELDALIGAARSIEIEDGPEDDALALRAALAGRARHEARQRRNVVLGVAGSFALAAAIALALLVPRRGHEGERAVSELAELTLPAGDRLTATGDARFDVLSSVESLRVARLRRGAMLFDVAPLGHGSRFEVETPDARVRVRGTIFAVEVSAAGTAVRVYEGEVELERTGRPPILLHAGDQDGVPPGGSERLAHLDPRGRIAASRRASPPPVEPMAADVSAPSPAATPTAPVRDVRAPRAPRPQLPVARDVAEPDGTDETPTLESTRALLAAGSAERALEIAGAAHDDPAWRLLEADALRSLGRNAEAAEAYEDAAHRLGGVAARAPAFLAAELRLRRLHDPAASLRVLDETGVDAIGSPLRERGLALRADALDQLGRREELARAAAIYLEELPTGPHADWMRAHLE